MRFGIVHFCLLVWELIAMSMERRSQNIHHFSLIEGPGSLDLTTEILSRLWHKSNWLNLICYSASTLANAFQFVYVLLHHTPRWAGGGWTAGGGVQVHIFIFVSFLFAYF